MVGLGKTVKNVILLKNKVKSKCMNISLKPVLDKVLKYA